MTAALLTAITASLWAAEPGAPRDVTALVPADALIALIGRPDERVRNGAAAPAGAPRTDAPTVVQQLLLIGKQLNLLPAQARTAADVAACLPLLGQYPFAFVLLDVTSRELRPGAFRLNDLQAAMVFDTSGDDEAIAQRIRQLLGTYTNSAVSIVEKITENGVTRYRLTDARLPDWAVVEWGPVGGSFIVAIGRGAFDRMAAVHAKPAAALSADTWFRTAHEQTHGDRAFFEITVAVQRLRDRLGEVVRGRPEQVLTELGGQDVQRLLCSIGMEERAVVATGYFELVQENAVVPFSTRVGPDDPAAGAIPAAARSYAYFYLPTAAVARRCRDAWLAAQDPHRIDALHEAWARIEAEDGFSAEDDLLKRLGRRIVIHDYPPHPLGLPLLWTFAIETDGDTARVRRGVDGLMRAWQDSMQRRIARHPRTGLAPQLRRTDDGIWFIRLGLAGPAIGVAPGWIVIGFSPEAVRENLSILPPPAPGHAASATPVDTSTTRP